MPKPRDSIFALPLQLAGLAMVRAASLGALAES
ncbi:hypothetical protein O166_15235 [Pseudogulbenkiania ferrooxidans EGD-HP2]|uniref:Uncharacterized protein n=1 Tax=Pseudogulbenkiania ferrooxidans EGD-HP2 TaxID=1388764 RepID=A0ABN0N283_9NEIS|nr:hypothetical protein O166_15235 [Pseudogulbenkiania ferrooxidans EGD-HP2]